VAAGGEGEGAEDRVHGDAQRSPRPVPAQGEHEQAEDDHQREEDRALDEALERAEGGRVEDEQSEQDGYRLRCPGAHAMCLVEWLPTVTSRSRWGRGHDGIAITRLLCDQLRGHLVALLL